MIISTSARDDKLRRHGATIDGETHLPYPDDGVIYCGWFTGTSVQSGCGELWPCSKISPLLAGDRA